jgi:hypothetical protein
LGFASRALLNLGEDNNGLNIAGGEIRGVLDSLGGGRGQVVGDGSLRSTGGDSDDDGILSSLEGGNVNVLARKERTGRGLSREGRELANSAHVEDVGGQSLSKSLRSESLETKKTGSWREERSWKLEA